MLNDKKWLPLDLYCLQRQSISGFSRTRVKIILQPSQFLLNPWVLVTERLYNVIDAYKIGSTPILSAAVAYLCVIADQHFLNYPHCKINTVNHSVLVPFNTVVCSM